MNRKDIEQLTELYEAAPSNQSYHPGQKVIFLGDDGEEYVATIERIRFNEHSDPIYELSFPSGSRYTHFEAPIEMIAPYLESTNQNQIILTEDMENKQKLSFKLQKLIDDYRTLYNGLIVYLRDGTFNHEDELLLNKLNQNDIQVLGGLQNLKTIISQMK